MKIKHDVRSDSWDGCDGLGRRLPGWEECGSPRNDRFVGIFYFLCNNQPAPGGPFDVTKTIALNPSDPPFVAGQSYYWGEPELGYYLSWDPWVLRRHAYLLADAGVDTLIFDTTNNVTYPETYQAICEVFTQIRQEGEATPQICFLASEKSIDQVWENLYRPGHYQDLWFQWKGKPLLLFGQWELFGDMNQVVLRKEIQDFFTIRKSWAWDSLPWYGENGYHRWPWVAHYPQCIGWDEPGKAEMIPVAVGQHPLSNIGRSFHQGQQPPTNEYDLTAFTELGLHFSEQWQRALEVDPEFIFITGWNEWTAGPAVCDDTSQEALQAKWNFFPGAKLGRAGRPLKLGDHYFIDQYNQEYSRDAEPMWGGHTDNYYYQMMANIRRFKGVRPPMKASAAKQIDLGGDRNQWLEVAPEFLDHCFETLPSKNPELPGRAAAIGRTGRNEFVRLKVAFDDEFITFMAETRTALTAASDPNWMMLFIDGDRRKDTGWEGYDYLINWPVKQLPGADGLGVTSIQENRGGWSWKEIGEAAIRVDGNQLWIAVPRRLLGMQAGPLNFNFHWADNLQQPGETWDFLISGDSAPARRLDYHFEQ